MSSTLNKLNEDVLKPLGWYVERAEVWLMEDGLSGYCAICFQSLRPIVVELPTLNAVKTWAKELQRSEAQQLIINYRRDAA